MRNNPYHNLFYYYRGSTGIQLNYDIQLENNATKALINTLELTDPFLTFNFLSDLKIEFNRTLTPNYELQVVEKYSIPDALINIGKTKVYIESKVNACMDAEQINNHLKSIGSSFLIVITPRESDKELIDKIEANNIRFITWEEIYVIFMRVLSNQLTNNIIIEQYLKYLEYINVAPFTGFTKQDFDSFLYIESDPTKEIRLMVKNKFAKFLEEIKKSISVCPDYQGLKIEIGNLKTNSLTVWATLSQEGESKVQVPHYNFEIDRNNFAIGFIAEGKTPAQRFINNIRKKSEQLLNILKELDEYSFDIINRIYLYPRVYRYELVASIKCGKDFTIFDMEYLINKTSQFPLSLLWVRMEIQRDDQRLRSKEFINTAINALDKLKALYQFSLE